jgi:hypothetical protein
MHQRANPPEGLQFLALEVAIQRGALGCSVDLRSTMAVGDRRYSRMRSCRSVQKRVGMKRIFRRQSR